MPVNDMDAAIREAEKRTNMQWDFGGFAGIKAIDLSLAGSLRAGIERVEQELGSNHPIADQWRARRALLLRESMRV